MTPIPDIGGEIGRAGRGAAEERGDGGDGLEAAIALFRPALVSATEVAERDAELARRKVAGAGGMAGRMAGGMAGWTGGARGMGGSELRCPRCGAGPAEVGRWGRFAGRPRYRCRGCGRTFTALTGAPQAYSKHQRKWSDLGRCLAEKLTVRETAKRLGVAPSTAFRWRHRALADLTGEPRPVLRGTVEVVEAHYPECHKGERKLPRPARRRGMNCTFLLRKDTVCVIMARDREGRGLVEPGCRGVPQGWALARALCRSLAEGSVVCTERYYWYQSFFRQVGVEHRQVRDLSAGWIQEGLKRGWWRLDPSVKVHNIEAAVAWRRELLRWLAGFRGVGVRYLPNYMAWFRHQPEQHFLRTERHGIEKAVDEPAGGGDRNATPGSLAL